MSIQQEYFKQIADKIRTKGNINVLIRPKDFANEIDTVYNNGYNNGFINGEVTGEGSMVQQFWDDYYTNAMDLWNNYRYASSNSFYNWYSPMLKWFNPVGTLKVTGNAASCFRYFCRDLNGKEGAINFSELLNEKGAVLDTSSVTTSNYLFSEVGLTHLPKIDLSSVTGTHNSVFYKSESLVSIAELKCNKSAKWTTPFDGCKKLEYVFFTGAIGNDISLKDCGVLNGTSIMTLIDTLDNTVTGKTLTLSEIAVNKAFETNEGANNGSTSNTWISLISNKSNQYNGNWTISLV